MAIRNIRRQATNPGAVAGTPNSAPIYVDSDDNILKMIPAGSGTTEVQIIDASKAQTLTNKTLTAPVISGAGTIGTQINTDVKVLASDFTTVTSTLAAITGFSLTAVAGATYKFKVVIPLVTMTTNGGFKMAFKLTTATLTSVNARVRQSTDTDNTGAVSTSFVTTTDVATWFDQKAVVYTQALIEGSFVVGTGGTIAVYAAQNTTHVDTTTITAGAFVEFTRTA